MTSRLHSVGITEDRFIEMMKWALVRQDEPSHPQHEQDIAHGVVMGVMLAEVMVVIQQLDATIAPCPDRPAGDKSIHITLPDGQFVCAADIVDGIAALSEQAHVVKAPDRTLN